MKRWIMIIDVAKCHNCNNCFMSCKDEHVGNDWGDISAPMPRHGQKWRDIECLERGQYPLIDVQYRPHNCMMCENAACIAAGNGAVYRREDGIVLIDREKAKGRRDIVDACPYGSIWWNEDLQLPQKCSFCAHLLDSGWTETRCSQVCPTGATSFRCVEESELDELIRSEGLERYRDELGTKPMVFYKNLYRFTKHFISGSLIADGECCECAEVTATDVSGNTFSVLSNAYGDFKIDGLEPGKYDVAVSFDGHELSKSDIALENSVYLGEITIK